MKKTTIGVFMDRNDAEKFINYAHNKISIPHDDISYLYKNLEGDEMEIDSKDVSSTTTGEGAKKGAGTGAVIGALGGIAAAAGLIPVIGPLLAAGPILAALGITGTVGAATAGAVAGAAVGGLVGALANLGVGKEKAKKYEDRVMAGDVLVAITSEKEREVREAMINYNAMEVDTYSPSV